MKLVSDFIDREHVYLECSHLPWSNTPSGHLSGGSFKQWPSRRETFCSQLKPGMRQPCESFGPAPNMAVEML